MGSEQAKSPAPTGAGLFCNLSRFTVSIQVITDVFRSAENLLRIQIFLLKHIANQIRWPVLNAKLGANGEWSINAGLDWSDSFKSAGLNYRLGGGF